MIRQRFPYEKKAIRSIFLFLILMNVLVGCLMFLLVPQEELLEAFLIIFSILVPITVVFGLSPLLTSHEVHETYIVLRQGWYYRNRIDLSDIISMTRVKNGPWSYGLHFIGNNTIYVNGRTKDLILLELKGTSSTTGKKRRMTRILFDTSDNDAFVRSIGRRFDRETDHY
ncbi:MAG: hypothetical protein HPY73_06605 [Methanomassiliicoccales archaeon]|nr:MAG: hypothetical protein HPY73_06605 [Methanomassiliicoccales archaeon]